MGWLEISGRFFLNICWKSFEISKDWKKFLKLFLFFKLKAFVFWFVRFLGFLEFFVGKRFKIKILKQFLCELLQLLKLKACRNSKKLLFYRNFWNIENFLKSFFNLFFLTWKKPEISLRKKLGKIKNFLQFLKNLLQSLKKLLLFLKRLLLFLINFLRFLSIKSYFIFIL